MRFSLFSFSKTARKRRSGLYAAQRTLRSTKNATGRVNSVRAVKFGTEMRKRTLRRLLKKNWFFSRSPDRPIQKSRNPPQKKTFFSAEPLKFLEKRAKTHKKTPGKSQIEKTRKSKKKKRVREKKEKWQRNETEKWYKQSKTTATKKIQQIPA